MAIRHAVHYAEADPIDSKLPGTKTVCGLTPRRFGGAIGFRWTDDPEKVYGCLECGAYARRLKGGATKPMGFRLP